MSRRTLDKQIDRFINNEMSGSEKESFSKQLEQDKLLQEKVHLQGILVEAILRHEEQDTKKALSDISESELKSILAKTDHTKLRIILKVMLYAAILVGFIFILNRNTYKHQPSELINQYYTIALPIEYFRSGDGTSPEMAEISRSVITAYKHENYQEVVNIYKKQRSKGTNNIILQKPSCLLSVCYSMIKIGQANEALLLLTTLSSDDSDYQEEGKWLQLYAFLSLDDREKAIKMAQDIANDQSVYMEQAKEILNKLEKKGW